VLFRVQCTRLRVQGGQYPEPCTLKHEP